MLPNKDYITYQANIDLYEELKSEINFDKVFFLISQGADYRAVDKEGSSLLLRACRDKNSLAVKTLIEMGSDVNLASFKTGISPLHEAVVDTLDSPVDLDIVARLVGAGADTNSGDKEGNTILYMALKSKRESDDLLESIKLIVEAGGDPFIQSQLGLSAYGRLTGQGGVSDNTKSGREFAAKVIEIFNNQTELNASSERGQSIERTFGR